MQGTALSPQPDCDNLKTNATSCWRMLGERKTRGKYLDAVKMMQKLFITLGCYSFYKFFLSHSKWSLKLT